MSADEKGFLSRWSERKREAARNESAKGEAPKGENETKQATPDGSARPAPAGTTEAESEQPFDLSSLPKLEDLTADTDMTVFFKKGVPETIRNAALRKSWALDPAIRNYVSPALDYAYDWNAPGGVPGAGELAPGTDIARMVARVFGEMVSQQQTEPETGSGEEPVADAMRQADAPPRAVRASEVTQPEHQGDADMTATAASGAEGEAQHKSPDVASQQTPRRHGSARPQ